ncbi:MAG: transposase [Desulfoprunum sp.]|nr:transposase [Desulfoprunum sp.]
MTKKRKKYTEEFRSSAVKLVTEQGYQITEAARNLGINATMLGRWKREIEDGGNGMPDSASGKDVQAELTRLIKENHRLKMECEILKKAAAFFANESGCGIK